MLAPAVTAVAVPAVYGIIHSAEKIADWKVNREIRRLERDKLAKELSERDLPTPPSEHTFDETLQNRGAFHYYESSIKRLADNELQIKEIQVSIVPELPPKRDKS